MERFDFDHWNLQAKEIMKEGLIRKFSQNKLCFQALQETGTTSLVEAATYDQLWGDGLSLTDSDFKNKLWKFKNWMSEAFEEVRFEFIG